MTELFDLARILAGAIILTILFYAFREIGREIDKRINDKFRY